MEMALLWQHVQHARLVAGRVRQRAILARLISHCQQYTAQAFLARRRTSHLTRQPPASMHVLPAPSQVGSGPDEADAWPPQGTSSGLSGLTVRMTAEDIAVALQDARLERYPARYCPLARAFCRALEVPLGHVTVGPYNVDCEAWEGRGAVEAFLPPHVTAAIASFDRRRVMPPLTFQVQLRPWSAAPQTTGAWGAVRRQARQTRVQAQAMRAWADEKRAEAVRRSATRHLAPR